MRTRVLFAIPVLLTVAAKAQTIDMHKTTLSNIETAVVEIHAQAIPLERMHVLEIDSTNYHKAINVGTGAEIDNAPQPISRTVAAVKQEGRKLSAEKKAIQISGNAEPSDGKKKVEVVAPAIRR